MMPPHLATSVPPGPPRNMLWTVDQFHYLGDLGMFEGRRAMLIDGVIVEEGPMNPPHRIALELSENVLRTAFGAGWRVCNQMPLVLGQTTDPEAGPGRDRRSGPAAPARTRRPPLFVVEVSDTSLRYDTTVKMMSVRGRRDRGLLGGRCFWPPTARVPGPSAGCDRLPRLRSTPRGWYSPRRTSYLRFTCPQCNCFGCGLAPVTV